MKRFAFISRHSITPEQVALAKEKGIELVEVGDRDGFAVDPSDFSEFDGVVVVHAAAALRLLGPTRPVGVFKNANRAPEGERPQFVAESLHVYEYDLDAPYSARVVEV